ncbi:hypothetical protein [Kribbella sp. NPDC051770]|uniref:hypothetical protein n=1 Tax=Kribbella sp. NPDC051770 TaxID=3155413 RepID=UPI00343EC260
MRIGELADASGVSTVNRVTLIQHLYAAGIPSTTSDELLPCLYAPTLRSSPTP